MSLHEHREEPCMNLQSLWSSNFHQFVQYNIRLTLDHKLELIGKLKSMNEENVNTSPSICVEYECAWINKTWTFHYPFSSHLACSTWLNMNKNMDILLSSMQKIKIKNHMDTDHVLCRTQMSMHKRHMIVELVEQE